MIMYIHIHGFWAVVGQQVHWVEDFRFFVKFGSRI